MAIRKRTLVAILVGAAVLWFAIPLYGFVSHQFEIARSPLGWTELPEKYPASYQLYDARYEGAGAAAISALAQRRQRLSAPSISAAVAIDGNLIWAGSVGWQSIEDEVPATPRTIYRLGSTSKPVTATGLARAVENGRVDLDTPISEYGTDLPNRAWDTLTLRQLASHTAGLAEYEENNDWWGFYQSLALQSRYDTQTEALSVVDGADMLFAPGTDFHYSGFDNILIAAVLESVTKQTFDEYMQKSVFGPNDLLVKPDHKVDGTYRAVSYQRKPDKAKPWRSVDLSHKTAAGGLASTPSDLVMLGSLWLDDDFISPDLREEFWTPVRLANRQLNEQNYALGWRRGVWEIDGFGQVEHLNHGGVSKGAQCWLMIVPEHNLVLALSINQRTDEFFDFADVYVEILKSFLEAKADLASAPY